MSIQKYKLRDHSEHMVVENIISYFFWGLISAVYYRIWIFQTLPNLTLHKSYQVLIALICGVCLIGFICRLNRDMSWGNVMHDIFVGLGLYTILSCYEYYRVLICFVAAISSLIIILSAFFILFNKYKGKFIFQIRKKPLRRYIIKTRAFKIYNFIIRILALASMIIVLYAAYNQIFEGGIVASSLIRVKGGFDATYYENEYSLEANIQTIKNIRSNETWQKLSMEEKLETLQAICNCEMNYNGMKPIVMVAIDMLPESTIACYSESEKIITVNVDYVKMADNVTIFSAMLHEIQHCYQYELVRVFQSVKNNEYRKLRIFMHCPEYINEMKSYKTSGKYSYSEYAEQYMEMDARNAESNVDEYFSQIDELINKEK